MINRDALIKELKNDAGWGIFPAPGYWRFLTVVGRMARYEITPQEIARFTKFCEKHHKWDEIVAYINAQPETTATPAK